MATRTSRSREGRCWCTTVIRVSLGYCKAPAGLLQNSCLAVAGLMRNCFRASARLLHSCCKAAAGLSHGSCTTVRVAAWSKAAAGALQHVSAWSTDMLPWPHLKSCIPDDSPTASLRNPCRFVMDSFVVYLWVLCGPTHGSPARRKHLDDARHGLVECRKRFGVYVLQSSK